MPPPSCRGTPSSSPSNNESSSSSSSSTIQSRKGNRKDILLKVKSGVTIKDRRYRLRVYKSCFIGSDLIDYFIRQNYASTREEAVILGQKYQSTYKLFKHVCDDHLLKDGYLFYRFIEFDDFDESNRSSSSSSNQNNAEDVDEDDATARISTTSSSTQQNNDSFDNDDNDDPHLRPSMMDCQRKIGLRSIGNILKYDLPLTYKFSIDRECFKANDLINFMVVNSLASDRQDAIQIGLALQREEIIESLSSSSSSSGKLDGGGGGSSPKLFRDVPRLYFGFVCKEDCDKKKEDDKDDDDDDDDDTNNNNNNEWENELASICKLLSTKLLTGNQVYHLKTYEDCFVGSTAITTIVNNLAITTSRRDAVLLCRSIIHEYQLFQHVTNDHIFEDSELFYRFTKQSNEVMLIMENFRNRGKK